MSPYNLPKKCTFVILSDEFLIYCNPIQTDIDKLLGTESYPEDWGLNFFIRDKECVEYDHKRPNFEEFKILFSKLLDDELCEFKTSRQEFNINSDKMVTDLVHVFRRVFNDLPKYDNYSLEDIEYLDNIVGDDINAFWETQASDYYDFMVDYCEYGRELLADLLTGYGPQGFISEETYGKLIETISNEETYTKLKETFSNIF